MEQSRNRWLLGYDFRLTCKKPSKSTSPPKELGVVIWKKITLTQGIYQSYFLLIIVKL